jgi:hypothetical protein
MKKTIALLAALAALTLTANAQSLLTDPPIPAAQARAIRAAENAQGLRNSILGGLRHSITDLWSDDYAANVATAQALGSNGAELYQLYQAFFASTRALLVASNDTASVAEIDALAARIPALTVNQDGTLTITAPDPTPEPTPEP